MRRNLPPRPPTSRPPVAALAIVLLALTALALPQGAAPQANSAPSDLEATYDRQGNLVALSWTPPSQTSNNLTYMVWRNDVYLGTTSTTSYTDMFGLAVPDPGYIYFVSAVTNSNNNGVANVTVSAPAIDGVSTLSCEVVNVSTSWNWPYVYAHLHEECLAGTTTYDRDVTWQRP